MGLVVVSNRLGNPRLRGAARAGGLEVALQLALQKEGGLWLGWGGKISAHPESDPNPHITTHGNTRYAALELSDEEHESYYVGYANSVLWPLFHLRLGVIDFKRTGTDGYRRVNAKFARDPDLFYASTHQWPLYPGTGSEHEHGVDGNVVNAPLPAGAGSAEFRRAFERRILPALDGFAPEIVLISAGFDAHADDPLASLNLVEADYGWATAEMCKIAEKHAKGRVVSALEGGYDLHALAASAAAHVRALMAA